MASPDAFVAISSSRSASALAIACLLVSSSVADAARTPPALCEPGRYLVEGAALVPGSTAAPDVIAIDDQGAITIESGCPTVGGKRKATRKGTKVKASWAAGACGAAVIGKAKLAARTDTTCQTLTGKFRAKKLKRKFTAQLSRCGDGFPDAGEACPLLEAPPEDLALDHVHDFVVLEGVPEAEIGLHDELGPVARTQVEIGFAADVTVGQMNAAIESISGTIVAMLADVTLVVVRIPDPGTVAALEAVAAQVAAKPGVVSVSLAGFDDADELPSNYAPASGNLSNLDHQLAVRGAAAWNARSLLASLTTPPVVVIGDLFGGGVPLPPDFDVLATATDFGAGAATQHGYHVLGIVSGDFGGSSTNTGFVTGAIPGTVWVRVADYFTATGTKLTDVQLEDLLLQRVASVLPPPIVMNTSLRIPCSAMGAAIPCTSAIVMPRAVRWIQKVRGTLGIATVGAGRENQFLHVTTAGNQNIAGDTNSQTNSAYSAAAIMPGLVTNFGPISVSVPNLTNVVVVENVQNGAGAPFSPLCLDASSKRPGHIAGMGTNIWSMTAASGAAGNLTGTSMASPQVAGFAAYLWSLRSTLTPQQARTTLLAAARPSLPVNAGAGCDPAAASAPVLDAYATVLGADVPGNQSVRRTILDLDANGAFDEADVEAFLDAFAASFGGMDWSRHDLNGDSMTGGETRAPFDLDADDPPSLETVSLEVGAGSLSFDETALRDLDVLCYYAWSDLFVGDSDQRDLLLATPCCANIEWILTRIGNATGDQDSMANAINDAGVVVGTDEVHTPFRWIPSEDDPTVGVRQALGLLAGHIQGGAEDINSDGRIVGSTGGPGVQTAVVWNDGSPAVVGPVAQYSSASSINDAGMITGSTNGIGAWVVEGPTVHPLGGWATVVNNLGALAGSADFPQFFVYGRPAFWSSPTAAPLYLGHFGGYGLAHDLNDAGLIVGTARAPSLPLPFTSLGSGLSQLPTIPGGFYGDWGDAYGVNDKGEVVGSLWLSDDTTEVLGERAVRWVDGQPEDLNLLMSPADQATFVLAEAFDINERGQIVGWGVELPFEQFTYHARAFLLTPRCGD